MKGPYTASGNTPKDYFNRVWYRTSNGQKKRTPLPYTSYHFKRNTEQGTPFSASISNLCLALVSYGGSHQATCKYTHALNDAYSKFREKIAAEATMGTNIAEYRQTADLLTGLFGALRHPLETFAKLAKKSRRKGIGIPGMAADAWLAWHFGVEPLLKDVFATMELLSKPIPPSQMVYGQGKVQTTYLHTSNGSLYANITILLRARVGARVQVTNPNVFLASRLGLINPASVAWDLVPFSFVVDWFFDLSQLLASCSDFAGLALSDAYYTTYGVGSSVEQEPRKPPLQRLATYEGFSMIRSTGLYQPTPVPRCPNLGLSRAATAASLLHQLLRRFA